jgi:dUTP pyrophosphatase
MNIEPMHPNFKVPSKGTELSGGYDIYAPEAGELKHDAEVGLMIPLGFAAEIPVGYVGMLVPRSGKGAKHGLELNNTCGIIDADYRGQWMACLRIKNHAPFSWEAGEAILQLLIVPVLSVDFTIVDSLSETDRGDGGFGSTDKKIAG